ncbi:hypothetical protein [Streptomyces asiaticus]
MSGVALLASVIATGRLHGVGVGSSVQEVDQMVKADFMDVVEEEYGTLRRDYGFVEIYFSGGPGSGS